MAAFFERSRSYGVGLTVATQNPSHPRLRPILDSVLMNTRTHVVFGGLRAQVRHFTDEMAPTFTQATARWAPGLSHGDHDVGGQPAGAAVRGGGGADP